MLSRNNALPIWMMIIPALTLCPGALLAQTTWIVDQGGGGDFSTIQACIDDVSVLDGDTCLVTSGTYFENLSVSGKTISLVSMEGPEFTVIDGGGAGTVVSLENGGPGPFVLDGFTIRDGYTGETGSRRGAGIHVECVLAVVRDCLITESSGDYYASAVRVGCDGGHPYPGGLEMEDCRVNNNFIDGLDQTPYAGYTSLSVVDSEFEGNDGFGIQLWSGSIHNSSIRNNTLGISAVADFTSVTISRCYVSGNSGVGLSGVGLRASAQAGGYVEIVNTVVTQNKMGFQSYTYQKSGSVYLYHSTISGNTEYEVDYGGDYGGGDVHLINSILWGELGPGIEPILYFSEVKFSDFKGFFLGQGNINIDPMFMASDDLRLKPLSLCIDRAMNAGFLEDIDGNLRPQGGGYDMGAYESIPGSEWSLQKAQAATLYDTPKQVEDTSRNNLLLALLLIPGFVVLLLKRLAKGREPLT